MRWRRNFPKPTSASRSGRTASPRRTTISTRACSRGDFADWRLEVAGLVEKPLSLSREQLIAMPSRTQITRHDCVEGWSCIAKWTGVPLPLVLDEAKVKPRGALRRLPLPRLDRARPVRRRQILRLDRPDRRPPPADDPRLRPERQAAAGRERRAAARPRRAPARLQDAEIHPQDRAGRQLRRRSASARAAIGKTAATTGTAAFEDGNSRVPPGFSSGHLVEQRLQLRMDRRRRLLDEFQQRPLILVQRPSLPIRSASHFASPASIRSARRGQRFAPLVARLPVGVDVDRRADRLRECRATPPRPCGRRSRRCLHRRGRGSSPGAALPRASAPRSPTRT